MIAITIGLQRPIIFEPWGEEEKWAYHSAALHSTVILYAPNPDPGKNRGYVLAKRGHGAWESLPVPADLWPVRMVGNDNRSHVVFFDSFRIAGFVLITYADSEGTHEQRDLLVYVLRDGQYRPIFAKREIWIDDHSIFFVRRGQL